MRSKNRSTINFEKCKKTSITDAGHRSTDAISDYGISRDLIAIVRHARLEAGWHDWDSPMFIHEHRTIQFLKELTRICESKRWLRDHLPYPTQLVNSVSVNLEIFWGLVDALYQVRSTPTDLRFVPAIDSNRIFSKQTAGSMRRACLELVLNIPSSKAYAWVFNTKAKEVFPLSFLRNNISLLQ